MTILWLIPLSWTLHLHECVCVFFLKNNIYLVTTRLMTRALHLFLKEDKENRITER